MFKRLPYYSKYIKIVGSILLIGGFFVLPVFANATTTANTAAQSGSTFEQIMVALTGLFSWIWIFFAVLAGKFMSNTALYGSFANLDGFFITWWGMMRDIANFSLFFIALFFIGKGLIGNKTQEVTGVIKKLFVAGILIQASWFLIGAALDISTILVGSLGTVPGYVISQNADLEKGFANDYQDFLKQKIIIDVNVLNTNQPIYKAIKSQDISEEDRDRIVDTLLPTHKTLSGPLLFLGISILDSTKVSFDFRGKQFSDFLTTLGINGLILGCYTFAMFMLFIFSFLRIFVMWIFIPLSPLIVILKVFNVKLSPNFDNFFNVKNLLKLIFMPVAFVGFLSLILLFVISAKSLLQSGNTRSSNNTEYHFEDSQSNIILSQVAKPDGSDKYRYDSTLESDGFLSFTMKDATNSVSNLFLYIFTLLLVWQLVRMTFSLKTGIKMVDDTMGGLSNITNRIVNNIPIIPIPGRGAVGLESAQRGLNQIHQVGPTILNQQMVKDSNKLRQIFGAHSVQEVAQELANNQNQHAQFIESPEVKEAIQQSVNQGKNRIFDMPFMMTFLKSYGFDEGKTTTFESFLNTEGKKHITGVNKDIYTVLADFGFDKNGNYKGTSSSPSESQQPEKKNPEGRG